MALKPFAEADFKVDPNKVVLSTELGRGNFSRVFKAQYNSSTVAVKQQELVDADLERYLLNELAVLRLISHPGCISFYGAFKTTAPGTTTRVVNILTEYIEGGDLRRLVLDKSVQLGWRFRCGIALGVAQALQYMHELELIHRDIKTENVLLLPSGQPKLCDFGFARKWNKHKQMTMCGTDEFMAPEIYFGMQYDEKVDLFSYGILLAELLTRRAPGKQDGFLDRDASGGFEVNLQELDDATAECGAPQSLVLLTKECVQAEAHNRLSAADTTAWLEDFYKELAQDTEAKPVLTSDAVRDKIAQYLQVDDDDDERDGGGPADAPTNKHTSLASSATATHALAALPSPSPSPSFPPSPTSNGGGGGMGALTGMPLPQQSADASSNSSTNSSGLFSLLCGVKGAGGEKGGGGVFRAHHRAPQQEMGGWVTKRGGRIKTWKRRYMVVTHTGIVYFKSPEEHQNDAEAQGAISYAEMTAVAGVVCNAVPTVMTGKPHSFGVHTGDRTYYIAAASAEERGKWIRAITDGHRAFNDPKKKAAALAAPNGNNNKTPNKPRN